MDGVAPGARPPMLNSHRPNRPLRHDRPDLRVVEIINIRLDAERADLFVNHSFLFKLFGASQIETRPWKDDELRGEEEDWGFHVFTA